MIELRPYQEDALAAIWNYFINGKKGNPLIAHPTGTGKSLIPAIFIRDIMKIWPTQKFLLLTSVSELIKQNAEILKFMWPNAPLGVYSAGLKRKEWQLPVVYAGIQSAIKDPSCFGHRDIIWVDECHLINQEESSQYLTFLSTMKLINPNVRIIGMTATPFRMGQGYITDGGLFTDIVHDITGIDEFNKLIAENYLAPLIPLRTKIELDVSNVGMAKGEFIASQLQSAVDKAEITHDGLRELIQAGHNRKSWLIFASGIEHAEHISKMLVDFGISSCAVHSKQRPEFNDYAIREFKNGGLRSIVNYGKLTTGFNHPFIDLIGMFRPTLSVPLWIQMLGRGTRPAPGKENCLVLDFAKNTIRLGPINDPIIPKKKGDKQGDVPVKICDSCGAYNHTRVRFCCQCKNEFEFQIKIVAKSGKEELLRSDAPIIETFDVTQAIYAKKHKLDKNTKAIIGKPYIQTRYFCGMQSFTQNVFPEHDNPYPKKLFRDWWLQRNASEPPTTVDEALQYVPTLRIPKRIRVWCNKKFPDIVSCEF